MGPAEETPDCVHLIHLRIEGGRSEPVSFCSCPAGLVHLHDCPLTLGLGCVHYTRRESEPEGVPFQEFERLHDALMGDYLSRTYFHRVRGLAPGGDPWRRRREALREEYRGLEEPEDAPEEDDEGYEREKERLIRRRKEHEEARREREEKSREQRAQERARMGIKTVVEKARETVAARGNLASSIVDDVELPDRGKKRRRRRRKGDRGAKPPASGGPGASEGPAPGKKRRRRRRRRGKKPPDGGSA